MRSCTHKACQTLRQCRQLRPTHTRAIACLHDQPSRPRLSTPALSHQPRRFFHDYFVTHLPSSSLHPDSRSSAGPRHQLPRDASRPHTPSGKPSDPAPAPVQGVSRDTTVVRIPLRSAKHHFGAHVSRGQRPYNEDTYQAGVIELPAFAKRAPVSVTRAPARSPLAEYRRRQQEGGKGSASGDGEVGSEDGAMAAGGDPQVFYFGVFDGHGGTECSDFLKEQLHGYVERSAKDFGLLSSLQTPTEGSGHKNVHHKPSEASTGPDPTKPPSDAKHPSSGSSDNSLPPKSSPAAEQGVDQDKAKKLESNLLRAWKRTVGGYFRRFQPELFYDAEDASRSGADISTILTYAFLRADLDFITAQARKPTKDGDKDPAHPDQAINVDPGTNGGPQIGGPTRFEGGSTGSIAIVSTPTPTPFWHPSTPSTMVFAHVGDTRILLCRTADGLAVPCTSNHHPSSPVEEKRLRRFSGQVVTDSFGEERISGLANTRAFGDMRSKRIGVSAEPEVTRVEMAAAEYSFLVLISDGISGTLSDQEVVDIVKECRTPDDGARTVTSFATEVSRDGDNASCLVVRLGGWERRNEGGLGSMGTKEARDWRKEDALQPRSRRM